MYEPNLARVSPKLSLSLLSIHSKSFPVPPAIDDLVIHEGSSKPSETCSGAFQSLSVDQSAVIYDAAGSEGDVSGNDTEMILSSETRSVMGFDLQGEVKDDLAIIGHSFWRPPTPLPWSTIGYGG